MRSASNTKNIIGVIGGGQLGRMLALAAAPLGMRCRFYDPEAQCPASLFGPVSIGDFDQGESLQKFAQDLSLITCEFENIPSAHLATLSQKTNVYPPAHAFHVAQDRFLEKTFFQDLGVATAPFMPVETLSDLQAAVAAIHFPAILKTRRFGYDGKGQVLINKASDLSKALQELGGGGLILEGFVTFQRELSLIAVRSRCGETAFYPLCENKHLHGILRQTRAPAPHLAPALQAAAEHIGRLALAALDYVGVLVIEFFQQDQQLIVNEMAPRVHNSGHLTIEGAETSQFENHVRAICGLPLGSTRLPMSVIMHNIIGHVPNVGEILKIPGVHLHLYDKEAKPARKLGHITVTAPDDASLVARSALVASLLE